MDVQPAMPASIAKIISRTLGLTLGLAGAGGCGSAPTDPETDPETDSGTDSETDSETDSGTSWEDCVEKTDIDVADWAVTSLAYDGMRAAAELYGGLPWDMRDDASRCYVACAYARRSGCWVPTTTGSICSPAS